MRKLQFLIFVLLTLGISACATNQKVASQYPPDLSSKYIYAVEKEAHARNTRVYWVNAPSNEELEARLDKGSDKG